MDEVVEGYGARLRGITALRYHVQIGKKGREGLWQVRVGLLSLIGGAGGCIFVCCVPVAS